MTIFALRMRNGNCVVAAAENEAAARERAKDIGRDIEIASVRELSSFVARFTLTDEGELVSILLDRQTLSDLHSHEYPMLYAARSHSYDDFGPSPTNAPQSRLNTMRMRGQTALLRYGNLPLPSPTHPTSFA